MNRRHLAEKALRGLIADAASDEDFRRARRFAELNDLDYPERTSVRRRAGDVGRQSMPTSLSVARSARGRGASAAELRRYLDRLSARRSVA
jgi:hypothetical protein